MYRPMACACVGWRGVMRVWLVGGGKGSGSSASGRIIPHRCVHQRRPGCGVCVVLPSVAVPLACAHPAPSIRLPALPIQHPPSCRRESAPYGPPACRRWGAPAPPSSHPTPDTHSCRHSNTRQARQAPVRGVAHGGTSGDCQPVVRDLRRRVGGWRRPPPLPLTRRPSGRGRPSGRPAA